MFKNAQAGGHRGENGGSPDQEKHPNISKRAFLKLLLAASTAAVGKAGYEKLLGRAGAAHLRALAGAVAEVAEDPKEPGRAENYADLYEKYGGKEKLGVSEEMWLEGGVAARLDAVSGLYFDSTLEQGIKIASELSVKYGLRPEYVMPVFYFFCDTKIRSLSKFLSDKAVNLVQTLASNTVDIGDDIICGIDSILRAQRAELKSAHLECDPVRQAAGDIAVAAAGEYTGARAMIQIRTVGFLDMHPSEYALAVKRLIKEGFVRKEDCEDLFGFPYDSIEAVLDLQTKVKESRDDRGSNLTPSDNDYIKAANTVEISVTRNERLLPQGLELAFAYFSMQLSLLRENFSELFVYADAGNVEAQMIVSYLMMQTVDIYATSETEVFDSNHPHYNPSLDEGFTAKYMAEAIAKDFEQLPAYQRLMRIWRRQRGSTFPIINSARGVIEAHLKGPPEPINSLVPSFIKNLLDHSY